MVPFFSERPRDASREERREESQERIPLMSCLAGLALGNNNVAAWYNKQTSCDVATATLST